MYKPAIPALRRLGKEAHRFKTGLDYRENFRLPYTTRQDKQTSEHQNQTNKQVNTKARQTNKRTPKPDKRTPKPDNQNLPSIRLLLLRMSSQKFKSK